MTTKWLLNVALCAASGLLPAQSVVGSWQGTLQNATPPLRIVVQISQVEDRSMKAVFYSIDQGGAPRAASSVKLQDQSIKIEIAALGAAYDGRLSGDGNAIAGTFAQGNNTQPLNFTRETPETAWAIPEQPRAPEPMAADAIPLFEVATIKPGDPNAYGVSMGVGRNGGNLFTAAHITLRELIVFAYGVHPSQVTGGPAWMNSEKFDITAKPDQPGIPNGTQVRAMVQKLLVDRFQLAFHREQKEIAAYQLGVGKTGAKLSKSESTQTGVGFSGAGPAGGGVIVRNASMADFAGFLQARILDRPVVDRTGLTGRFDFRLQWKPEAQFLPLGMTLPQLSPEMAERPDLFTAFQEQLGLKIDSGQTMTEVLVIDRAAKPSEN